MRSKEETIGRMEDGVGQGLTVVEQFYTLAA
jgi:hypothetical protein